MKPGWAARTSGMLSLVRSKEIYLRSSLAYLLERMFGIAISFVVFAARGPHLRSDPDGDL